jgi:hypothetical protein
MVLVGLLWIPVIQGARGLYEYLQGVQGVPRAADLRGVLPRRLHEAAERAGLPVGAHRRVPARRVPAGRRHAGDAEAGGFEGGYEVGSFSGS